MKARVDYTNVPEALRGMYQLERYIHNSGLEESLVHLVKMRASQINGSGIASMCIRKTPAPSARPSRDSTCWTRGRRRRFTLSANARRPRLPRPSPGSRKAMCPTRSSSAHKRGLSSAITGKAISSYPILELSGFRLGNVSAVSEARRWNRPRSSAQPRPARFRYSRLNEGAAACYGI